MSYIFVKRFFVPVLAILGVMLFWGPRQANGQRCPVQTMLPTMLEIVTATVFRTSSGPTAHPAVTPCDGCSMDTCDYCCPYECHSARGAAALLPMGSRATRKRPLLSFYRPNVVYLSL